MAKFIIFDKTIFVTGFHVIYLFYIIEKSNSTHSLIHHGFSKTTERITKKLGIDDNFLLQVLDIH